MVFCLGVILHIWVPVCWVWVSVNPWNFCQPQAAWAAHLVGSSLLFCKDPRRYMEIVGSSELGLQWKRARIRVLPTWNSSSYSQAWRLLTILFSSSLCYLEMLFTIMKEPLGSRKTISQSFLSWFNPASPTVKFIPQSLATLHPICGLLWKVAGGGQLGTGRRGQLHGHLRRHPSVAFLALTSASVPTRTGFMGTPPMQTHRPHMQKAPTMAVLKTLIIFEQVSHVFILF